MTKHIFATSQCAHVWAAQTQDSGKNHGGTFYFTGCTIYSFGSHWPLATITQHRHAGNRVVVVNADTYGARTSKHMSRVHNALQGRTDELVNAPLEAIRYLCHDDERSAYGSGGWRKFTELTLAHHLKWFKARAAKYANPNAFRDLSETDRIMAFNTDHEAFVHLVNVLDAHHDDIPSYNAQDMADAIHAAFAKFNDPKRVKVREKNQARISLARMGKAVDVIEHRLREGWSLDFTPDSNFEPAFKTNPTLALAYMERIKTVLAIQAMDETHAALHPFAREIIRERYFNERYHTRITAEEWMNGKNGYLQWQSDYITMPTLVRRVGNRVETSRGAEVPFKAACVAFMMAQDVANGVAQFAAKDTRIGHFTLDSIDAEGNCTIGCHRIPYSEMLRLALREAPALVKPRYPLPAIIR